MSSSGHLICSKAEVSPRTLRGSLDAVEVTVDVSPLDLGAADVLSLSVRARDGDGGDMAFGVHWGEPHPRGGTPGPPDLECDDEGVSPAPSENAEVFRYAYRRPGRYSFTVFVAVGYCDGAGKVVRVRGEAIVGPGVLLSNGPLEPWLSAAQTRAPSGKALETGVVVQTLEPDGYITEIEIAWGDGASTEVIRYPLSDCVDPGVVYPGSSAHMEGRYHQFAVAGTYEASVTVRSSGCDGRNVQVVTKQVILSVSS